MLLTIVMDCPKSCIAPSVIGSDSVTPDMQMITLRISLKTAKSRSNTTAVVSVKLTARLSIRMPP